MVVDAVAEAEVVLHVDRAILDAVRRVEQPHGVDERAGLRRGDAWIEWRDGDTLDTLVN